MPDRLTACLLPCGVLALVLLTASCASRRSLPRGLSNDRLSPCPDSPNCLCSEDPAADHRLAPLVFTNDAAQAWQSLHRAVVSVGGMIRSETNGYLWATCTTPVLRFVDDVECRLDIEGKCIHVRSASRVGYSDFGANRRRLAALALRFDEEQRRVSE